MQEVHMKRQALGKTALGKAAVAFTALAVLLTLDTTVAAPRAGYRGGQGSTDGVRVFRFVSFSHADPTPDGDIPRFGMNGSGRFTPERGEVQGAGNYVRNNAADPVPRPALDFGTWQATDIVSFDLVSDGTYGRITSSVLVLRIRLFSDVDSSVSTGTLRLICNIGDAGITTGEPEGFRLIIDDTSFGEFKPLSPPVGLSHIGIEATP
jgi:hypothetical protein